MKLQVLKKLHIVPDYFMTERFWVFFSHLVKVTCLTSATFRSIGCGHCTYVAILYSPCSTLARLAVEYDLGKSFTCLFYFEP